MLSDDLEGWDRGWDEVQEGEEKCIQITDALHCTGETNTTLQILEVHHPLKTYQVQNLLVVLSHII